MKVQHIAPQILNSNQKKDDNKEGVRFTGFADSAAVAATTALRYFDVNQAIGANAMDVGTMVLPRSVYDFKKRGPSAGIETARRESCGTFNHAMVGVYGTVAGIGLAYTFRDKFGIRADKIFADNNTIDILARTYHEALKTNAQDPLKSALNGIFDKVKVFNTELEAEKGWVGIKPETKDLVVTRLYDDIKSGKFKTINNDTQNYIYSLITSATGGEKNVKIEGFGKESHNSLKTLISNIYNIASTFDVDKVKKGFEDAKAIENLDYLKSLKKFNLGRAAAGLGFATLFGVSVQPINMYLTKKKTGQDGFVGVPGREKDKSAGFKMQKLAGALIFATGALATITTNPKKLLSKVQFQGMLPTIDQLKLVYGMTIASRLLSARDKDEFRESAVKDSLGFLSLLVLGSLITKGSARLLDKSGSLINHAKEDGKGFLKWLTNSSLKTRDEVLYSALNKHGISTVKDGKALKFSELMKLLPKDDKITRVKLRNLNIAQLIGYAYSAIVLGFGIPKLNDYMTGKNEAKRLARLAEKEKAQGVSKSQSAPVSASQSKQNFTANTLVEKNKFFAA